MQRNMYEIFGDVDFEINKLKKVEILRANDSIVLRFILKSTFDERIKFFTTQFPEYYRPMNFPIGMAPSNLFQELKRLMIFIIGHPSGQKVSYTRKKELLCSLLESLEIEEAELVMKMFNKNLKISGLTKELVDIAFLGLLT